MLYPAELPGQVKQAQSIACCQLHRTRSLQFPVMCINPAVSAGSGLGVQSFVILHQGRIEDDGT